MEYNILIVDDSSLVRQVIVRMLGFSGLSIGAVFQAENGYQALELLERHRIDVVITDINMPKMDGMELVRRMEEEELLPAIPVVVVSSEGSDVRIGELKRRGVRGYLRKPFTPEMLVKVVREIVEEHVHV